MGFPSEKQLGRLDVDVLPVKCVQDTARGKGAGWGRGIQKEQKATWPHLGFYNLGKNSHDFELVV